MKKIREIFKKNVKLVIGIIIGIVTTGTVVYAANLLANNVTYDNTTSNLSATNVQGAIDELYTRSSKWIDPSYIDFTTIATNGGTILASKNGVCIKRNYKVSCFKTNNWAEEQNHIQQVFSDSGCYADSFQVDCNAYDFECVVFSYGYVSCFDKYADSGCRVDQDGSIDCDSGNSVPSD